MNFHHPPVREMDDGAMFRSRHIYILVTSLIWGSVPTSLDSHDYGAEDFS